MENVSRLFARQNIHDVPISRMYEASIEERTAAFQDLHGALEYVTETPELVEQRLAELEQALLRLPEEKTQVLRQATQQNLAYVESLKLCFLRAEHFDAERSAIRMAGHFETK
jgi:ABC-type transporter Mla subunit MlaD